MSSRSPTSVGFSLERLARRGGAEGPHRDGWGVAFYAGPDALLLREPLAASESRLVEHIERHGPPSDLVISHIRLATHGAAALRNTQPFLRELGGRSHVFAHNGELEGLPLPGGGAAARFRPVGDTDSEAAFCVLLDHLAGLWDASDADVPAFDARLAVVQEFAAELRGRGIANFLYADGDTLFVHAHRRELRDEGKVVPGMFVLERNCQEPVPDMSQAGIVLPPAQQALTLVASVALTSERWRVLGDGEVLAIRGGEIVARHPA